MKKNQPYEYLQKLSKEIRLLISFGHFLEWDQETFMPKGAIDFRTEQIELISSISHREKTSKRFKEALSALIDLKTGKLYSNHLSNQQKANLYQWYRNYKRETKLPNDFVKTLAKTTSKARSAWAEARKNNTFNTFKPYLKQLIDLSRKKADYIGYHQHPYDAFLGIYEPGMTTRKLQSLFSSLKPFLKDQLETVSKFQVINDDFLDKAVSQDSQMTFSDYLLKLMGVNPKHSRLDFSEHPFCSGMHPNDVRMTTQSSVSNLMHSVSSVMHEAGHALYELNLPKKHYGTPLGESCSYGIHESQSRFWETMIGLGKPFWELAYPKLQKTFSKELENIDLETFLRAINQVRPSLIRIHADEVSYILHIILRFEIELAFIEGIEVDLPKMWNQKMEELLGITPKNDREGCMQDIHWASGLFGYFPTYALGTLYAAQLYETFKKIFPTYASRVREGDLKFITEFLTQKIHRFGKEFAPLELIKMATGKNLSIQPYKKYLEEKFKKPPN